VVSGNRAGKKYRGEARGGDGPSLKDNYADEAWGDRLGGSRWDSPSGGGKGKEDYGDTGPEEGKNRKKKGDPTPWNFENKSEGGNTLLVRCGLGLGCRLICRAQNGGGKGKRTRWRGTVGFEKGTVPTVQKRGRKNEKGGFFAKRGEGSGWMGKERRGKERP